MSDELLELAERVSKTFGLDNALDVQVEVALFEPNVIYSAVRPNAAGTKVIYTEHGGQERTCWARDWTYHRFATSAALRARASRLRMEVE